MAKETKLKKAQRKAISPALKGLSQADRAAQVKLRRELVAANKAARKATGSQMTKAEAERFAKGTIKKKKAKAKKKTTTNTVGGVSNLFRQQRKQREAIFK